MKYFIVRILWCGGKRVRSDKDESDGGCWTVMRIGDSYGGCLVMMRIGGSYNANKKSILN